MSTPLILALAMVLDAVFGEPKWLWDRVPHPAVLMGRLVGWFDRTLNQGVQRRIMGIATMFALAVLAIGSGLLLQYFGGLISTVIVAILLAQKSLMQHVRDVARALRLSVGDGRLMVTRIVGRDTRQMDRSQIARAAIESAAENFSDGVIAPAFWFLVGGLPGLFLYKITNTADSMIGYRTERHAQFGWAAARFDDVLNLIPARLSALLIALVQRQSRNWPMIASEARQHRSPNAGWPEAALARGLDVALSGPRSYEGKMQDFPYVNPNAKRDIGPDEIDQACAALWQVWGLCLAVCAGLAMIWC